MCKWIFCDLMLLALKEKHGQKGKLLCLLCQMVYSLFFFVFLFVHLEMEKNSKYMKEKMYYYNIS